MSTILAISKEAVKPFRVSEFPTRVNTSVRNPSYHDVVAASRTIYVMLGLGYYI